MQKHVGIWIRVSTEEQANSESPEHHEKRGRYYAESKSWLVKDVYHLEAVSGKSVMEHSETKRMLADVRSGKITGLVFSKLARLARNTRELLEFSDIFRDCNADLISLQESIDTSTPAGRLFFTMIAALGQAEREEIADRVAASVPIRAKLGKPLGGQAPFGFQWLDRKLIPDPKEAPVRKLIYELFLEHKRRRTVASLLNKAGHRTRNGGKFSDTTVFRLLTDPIAKGQRRANYTKSLGEKKSWKLKPEDQWIFTDVERIVSEAVWTQCNEILQTQRSNHKPPAKKALHLFTSYAFCMCGGKMTVPSNSPKYICGKCRNKIGETDLESIFHEQLKTFLFSGDEINDHITKANGLIAEKEELIRALLEEQKQTRVELDKIISLYVEDQIPKESVAKHYQPLEQRYKQIEDQIPRMQGEIDFLRIQSLSSNEVIQEAKDLHARWSNLDMPEKRNIIETITQRITIGQDEVTIQLSYVPSSSELMAEWQRNLILASRFCQSRSPAQSPPKRHKHLIPGVITSVRRGWTRGCSKKTWLGCSGSITALSQIGKRTDAAQLSRWFQKLSNSSVTIPSFLPTRAAELV